MQATWSSVDAAHLCSTAVVVPPGLTNLQQAVSYLHADSKKMPNPLCAASHGEALAVYD
jgi:hypothetical protein